MQILLALGLNNRRTPRTTSRVAKWLVLCRLSCQSQVVEQRRQETQRKHAKQMLKIHIFQYLPLQHPSKSMDPSGNSSEALRWKQKSSATWYVNSKYNNTCFHVFSIRNFGMFSFWWIIHHLIIMVSTINRPLVVISNSNHYWPLQMKPVSASREAKCKEWCAEPPLITLVPRWQPLADVTVQAGMTTQPESI